MEALEIYRPTFKSDGVFIWSSDNVMSLMNASDYDNSDEMMNKLADILNGKRTPVGSKEYTYSAPEILLDGKPLFVVRGWGHLTGQGALNLDRKMAADIQDKFAQWVISKLKGE